MRKKILFLFISICSLVAFRAEAQLNKEYFFYVGRNFIIDSKYSDAIETLNVLLKVDSTAYEAYFLRGIAKYNLDDLLGAERDFTLAIRKNPVYTLAYHFRAVTRSRLGNYDDALTDFRDAIELRPDLPGPYYSRGVTYLLSQQFQKAIDDFDEFLKFEPRYVDAYINKGTAYLNLKDTVNAYSYYNQAIKTNRLNPEGYNRRGTLYMAQNRTSDALDDFNKAISCDSTQIVPYFNRAILYANSTNPVRAISDFGKVISLDSTISISYFNRAIIRSQIGDYNNALADYDKVAKLSPNNVLVFYNRAGLNSQLGFIDEAIRDYTKSIELYPDFANAYLGRSNLRYLKNDMRGSQADRKIAERKIAEYRSKLTDSTFSIYADTSRQFNRLLSFDSKFAKGDIDNLDNSQNADITLLPLFRFSLMAKSEGYRYDDNPGAVAVRDQVTDFLKNSKLPQLSLTNAESDLPPDSIFVVDKTVSPDNFFARGVTQSLIRQYTNSIASYTKAIEQTPTNPFYYLNRSTTRSEMIDFMSSIDNGYSNIAIDSDPVNRLKTNTTRTYSYDDAIADLNKAAKLLPNFAHIYYNRANLHCLSGDMPHALADYTRAIELYPYFAQAYYNRGLVQIYLKDTKKGLLDISKAGELGIKESYEVLKRYSVPDQNP